MSDRHYQAIIDSPIPGVPSIGVRVAHELLQEIEFLFTHHKPYAEASAKRAITLLQDTLYQGRDPERPVEHALGTPFQRRVWRELALIPRGETRRYGELAKKLHSSPRAVAGACRRNQLPLLIPCHRVVAKDGMGGFMGKTDGPALAIKQWLLQHEAHE